MNKLLVALCALVASSSVMADLVLPKEASTQVKCTRVNTDKAGNPSEAEMNAFIAAGEREAGRANTASVSVSYLGNSKALVCRTVQP